MPAGTAAKALLKSRCPPTPITSAAEAEHPRFVIPTPNGGESCSFTPASVVEHVVYAELFGVADSSAAFDVGMTRTIEQGDPESFSANRFSRIKFVAVTARLEAEPFQKATIARVFQQPLKPRPFKTLCNREIERFHELPDYLSALGWSK